MNFSKEEKKQGRPKKKITKKNIVTAYLTDDENSKFQNSVEKSGLGIAGYLRSLIAKKI